MESMIASCTVFGNECLVEATAYDIPLLRNEHEVRQKCLMRSSPIDLFAASHLLDQRLARVRMPELVELLYQSCDHPVILRSRFDASTGSRSEEHTSELQSLTNLVCRLL